MKNITDWNKYTTENPLMIPYSIVESRGVPNSIKILTDIVMLKINKYLNNEINIISIDSEYPNIFNLFVSVEYYDQENIYAFSKFGSYGLNPINKKDDMKSPSITIKLPKNYNNTDLKRVVMHELLHIYEIYNRMKNKSKKDLQWKANQHLISIRNKYSDKLIQELIFLIYLSFDQEIGACVSEIYPILVDSGETKYDKLMNVLENTIAWKYMLELREFNLNNYTIDYEEMINFFHTYNTLLGNGNGKFKIFSIPTNKKDVDKILSKYKKLFLKKSLYFEKNMKRVIVEFLLDIEKDSKAYVEINESLSGAQQFQTKYK